ncbi:MAG TPA: DUF5615 family PIN-like protein [Propylenella sp.]
MRFLADECISRRVVDRLLAERHEVVWVTDAQPGHADAGILEWSQKESRILLTDDWDFGELAIRFEEPAYGIVIVAISQFKGNPEGVAAAIVGRLTELNEGLIGNLTILEAGRVRQRGLVRTGQR